MKKLILLLTLALIASSANATMLLFSDNYNVNQIASGSDGGTPNWRLDAAGDPVNIPGQPATRQSGLYAITDYAEVGGPWYLIQMGSEEGDLPDRWMVEQEKLDMVLIHRLSQVRALKTLYRCIV